MAYGLKASSCHPLMDANSPCVHSAFQIRLFDVHHLIADVANSKHHQRQNLDFFTHT